jgi:ribosomal protein L12E/L44/L45/RPP1/RPP2
MRFRTSTSAQFAQIIATLNHLEQIIMTEQAHIETDVAAILAAVNTEIAQLKAQPGAEALDFTSLDNLVATTQADAAADAPVAPPAPPVAPTA